MLFSILHRSGQHCRLTQKHGTCLVSQTLELSHRLFVAVQEVGALEQLKVADFSDNHIEALPEDLKGLVNLTDLTLSNNTLLALPDSIGKIAQQSTVAHHMPNIECAMSR